MTDLQFIIYCALMIVAGSIAGPMIALAIRKATGAKKP